MQAYPTQEFTHFGLYSYEIGPFCRTYGRGTAAKAVPARGIVVTGVGNKQ